MKKNFSFFIHIGGNTDTEYAEYIVKCTLNYPGSHETGFFGVHSFNVHYISIPAYTFHGGNRFMKPRVAHILYNLYL